ncbi:hypothetical protein KIF53_09345 [Chromobacterium subtsugae]|uniref:Lysozyme n=1 Tax=Chromobacterium subtsugae TaxID=251747 RepID=A0ABS7FCU9_9NEIS|nr:MULTISPECIES: hypothetical protein [Chromobacterium]KUM04207.1 hypothetical protein Cv017_15755 [Chromobacterium subtsugae]KZE85180.1 hypothetical protein AWB61_20660 [Chromobacterium sp. F49]MBW7566314.1 hypothetical protein [Chromobacterium subtsugae]MBW8287827.1 hypothetical protein [Chromobacterium subtsugae]WSE91156.1 hypothetical protein U6115_20130 [Chromobacterium subtsugae]
MPGRIYALGCLLLAALWGGSAWWAYGHGVDVTRREWALADAQRGATEARTDLAGYRAEVERLQALSVLIENKLDALRQAQPKIIERYNRVVENQPLPADCRPGPERLRELNAAIEAVNAAIAGKYGEGMQAN